MGGKGRRGGIREVGKKKEERRGRTGEDLRIHKDMYRHTMEMPYTPLME